MKQTWRWFGPQDTVSLDNIRQAGADGVVTALHHVAPGVVWTRDEILKRKDAVEKRRDGTATGLTWDVVESLPVSEDIKKQSGDWRAHIETYCESLRNLAAEGLQTVCYNFMPILDWTRTDLAWELPTGGTCMRFDLIDFAAFDLHILERPGAVFSNEITDAAHERFAGMDQDRKDQLVRNVVFGLPGSAETMSLDDVRELLGQYADISKDRLRANFVAFLEHVAPVAEELGMRLCCHPDDPPFDLLGLPRIMSSEEDYRYMVSAVDLPANGITLCSGSLGVNPANDLPGMMQRMGDKVHFIHLRNVKSETDQFPGSFHEAEHLAGNTDMVALIGAILAEEAKRRDAGRADHCIPMRPDHGQDIADDLGRQSQPGYPLIGRLKGLAELRGIEAALSHPG
ncbi:MAG: mannonate dehydratase [Paracoccaceae bacterium]